MSVQLAFLFYLIETSILADNIEFNDNSVVINCVSIHAYIDNPIHIQLSHKIFLYDSQLPPITKFRLIVFTGAVP